MRELRIDDIHATCRPETFGLELDKVKRVLDDRPLREAVVKAIRDKAPVLYLQNLTNVRSCAMLRAMYLLLGCPTSWEYLRIELRLCYLKDSLIKEFVGSAYPYGSLPSTNLCMEIELPSDYESFNQLESETHMSQIQVRSRPFFEVCYLTDGKPISALSNSEIYSGVAAQEKYIETLESVKNKPKSLIEEIEKAKEHLKSFLAHVDALRDAKA